MKRRITIKSLLSALICMTLTTGVFGQSFGSGNYTLKTNLGVTLPALTNATLAWGDYNNDGNLDLLVSGVNSGNQLLNVLYKNNGNSTFTEVPTTIPAVKDGTYAWGDMNNDGLLDLVVTGNDGAGLIAKIYKNCGSSCGYQFELLVDFGTTTEWFSPIEGSSLSLGDFNNDGLVDIATIGKRAINDYGHYGKVSILKNNGNGTFSVYFDGIPMCHRGSIQFADYDNMGDLEFAFNGVNDWGHVFGLRYYQTGSSYAIDYYQWLENFKDGMLAFADFDNDGKLDLLTSGDAYGTNDQQSKGPFTRMHKNNGIGGAYHALEAFAWVKNSKIAVCDYNNDGFADFFLSGETGDGSKMRLIYKNNGDFTFTVVDNDAVLGNGATAWGDYNNDGKADLAIIGKDASGSPYFNIYENNTANANTAPTAPTNLLTNVQTDKVDFTWTAGADANQTGGLTYILSVGTTAGGNDIVSEYALPKGTSIGQIVNTSWTLKKTLPNNAQYYWSVQAIDQSFARSTKATGSFVKGVLPLELTSNCNVSTLTLSPNDIIHVLNGASLSLNTSIEVNNIVLSPGSKLTLENGNTLTANQGIVLQSDATGTATFVDTNNNSPQAVSGTVQQYLTAARNWYTTSPVAAGTAAGFNLGTSVQSYSESAKVWTISNSGDALIAGKGYVSVATTGTGATGTISFIGTLNTGTITVPVTRTGIDKAGFNLVANPYPSYLDWSLVAADPLNANIGTTMWFRTKTAGNLYTFSTYNSAGNVAVANGANSTITKFIPPMQAFWIRVNNGTASTNLTFKNTMRAHKDGNGNTLKAPRLDNQQLVRLQVSNGTSSDETVVYFNSDALDGYDKYDSPKMFESTTVMKPEIYTQVGTEKLVINGMAELKYNSEIMLGFTTAQTNSFSIKTSEFKNFEVGTKLMLLDKSTNPTSEIELSEGVSYNFNYDISSPNADRFSILFRAPEVSTGFDTTHQLNAHVIVKANNQISIIAAEKCNYTIYNAMGQLIENGILSYKLNTINCKLMQGMYLVRVSGNGKEITTKVILK